MRTTLFLLLALLASALLFPPQWYPPRLRFEVAQWAGTPPDAAAAAMDTGVVMSPDEPPCPPDLQGWRAQQIIEGVTVGASGNCSPDNPHAVAAFVRGTNNVSQDTLLRAGLAPDAVTKGRDLDGDGDSDEIHIRLEVTELNGGSPDSAQPVAQYAIAPGVMPGLWVFTPKSFGMATGSPESVEAIDLLRLPSPSIRVEQGDRVQITLENTHYLPHTLHFHGVDHPWRDAGGEGNDGVPMTSEMPLAAGKARTYEMTPRAPGTMFYHCHVQPQAHVLMGMQGMFIVEENLPDNELQTMNIGAGHVRVRSQQSIRDYDDEYDLHYTNLDSGLSGIVQRSNEAAEIERWINGGYNLQESHSDLYTLNGRAFPYTFRESLVLTEPDQRTRLRVLNAGSEGLALHTHGHKARVTHYDGAPLSAEASYIRDVFWIASGQRVDLTLDTRNDGTHAYGSGVWMLHDHQGRGVMTNGIAPGGNVSAIVYREFLGDDGWPITFGEDLGMFFDADFYQRKDSQRKDSTAPIQTGSWFILRLFLLGLALGAALWCVSRLVRGERRLHDR